MKNYVAVALALAGVVMATPAFAGSAGVRGGTRNSHDIVDYVEKHVNHVYIENDVVDNTTNNYVDNVQVKNQTINNTNITAGSTKTVKNTVENIVKQTATVKGKDTNHSNNTTTKSAAVADGANVQSVINSLADKARLTLTKQGRGMYTDIKGAKNLKVNSDGTVSCYTNGSRGWGTYKLMTSSSLGATKTSKKTVSTDKTTSSVTSNDYVGTTTTHSSNTTFDGSTTSVAHDYTGSTSQSNTSYDNATETLIGIEYQYSPDAILLGDTDAFGKSYAAQGDTTRVNHFRRDEYYTETVTVTNHYNDTVTTTNNYTTTNTTTNTANYVANTTNYITTIKNVEVKYTADLTAATTPIVLDLDGDGKIEASNGKYLPHQGEYTQNMIMFDFNGNGFPVAMEWVGTNDGLLCRPNEDGTVTGKNLFGSANGYENGFDEMSTLDADSNGALEGSELDGLMVWVDENHNGVTDKGELKTLESLGITSIGVAHDNFVGTFTRNGKQFKSFDWFPSYVDGRKVGVAVK